MSLYSLLASIPLLKHAIFMTMLLWFIVCILTSLQSLLFAAGLRPTPAQATVVSWVSCQCVESIRSVVTKL